MSKPLSFFNLVFVFVYQISLAQNTPELINSGELIAQGAKLNDDGKYKEAIQLYSKISRSDTNYSAALHELAFSCYVDSQIEASLNYARTGLKLFPEKSAEWYTLMGNAYDQGHQRNEAIRCYDSALKLRPYNYLTWFNKGIACYNINQYDEAKACLQRAVLINPYHSSSHYFLGAICVAQGKIVPAMLSFTTCLLANPGSRYMNSATKYLSQLSKMTDDITAKISNSVHTEGDNFELQQEIIVSEVALDKNYKLQTGIDDPITRQLQVLFEKLQFDAGDKGFWMQFYVPFYTNLFKKGQFDPFVNYIFSGLDIKAVKDYNRKNSKEVESFTSDAVDYLNAIRRTEAVNYADRTPENYKYYYGSDNLLGIGKWTERGEDDDFYGPWEFFYDNGQLKSKGNFNNNGEREGEWVYYYANG
ncbi:MAG TPA: tetratricopeptide repeat protein, partial [Parafilimonas sp.]|nr:tetratricopeptide repeat protein [Parafilimonas sp.]